MFSADSLQRGVRCVEVSASHTIPDDVGAKSHGGLCGERPLRDSIAANDGDLAIICYLCSVAVVGFPAGGDTHLVGGGGDDVVHPTGMFMAYVIDS